MPLHLIFVCPLKYMLQKSNHSNNQLQDKEEQSCICFYVHNQI